MQHKTSFDFSFEVTGKIWKVQPNESTGDLAVEIRDADGKEVNFIVFYWGDWTLSDYFSIPELGIWASLSAFLDKALFFDHYSDPQDPGTRDLVRYDLESDEFERFPKGILTHTDRGYEIHAGEQTQVFETEFTDGRIRYPVAFLEGSEDFDLVRTYLGKEIVLGVEYFEENGTAVVVYYERDGSRFSRYLVVFDDEQTRIEIKLDDGLSGFAEGGYMIIQDVVVFICNSIQLNGFKI